MPTSRSGALTSGMDENSGILKFVLRTFNRSAGIFTDVSVAPNASFQTVPGQLPYAGATEAGSGFTITAGVLTVTTPFEFVGAPNITTAAWTAITIRLGTGVSITYTAGSVGSLTAYGANYYLYIHDPYSSGGALVYVSATRPDTSAAGTYLLDWFWTPNMPSGGPGTQNVFTIELA